jgi:hypothetical protein
MSLSLTLTAVRPTTVFSWSGLTHNLGEMAEAASIYHAIWRPEEIGADTAEQIIPLLRVGLDWLKREPEFFKKFNPENGWGHYEDLVDFVEKYLVACEENPDARISAWR